MNGAGRSQSRSIRLAIGGRIRVAVAACAAVGLCVAALAFGPSLNGAVTGDVRLVLSANCKTLLETCGCPSDKAGGFPEKAALLEQYRREGVPVVILDAGDAIEATDPPEKAEVMLRAMAAAGYQALNIGDQEALRGADFIVRMASLTPMALVSSNLVYADTREPVVKPFVIIEAGSAKIGVLGVVGANVPSGGGGSGRELAVTDAEEAIKRYLPQVRERANAVVVLAHVSRPEGRRLAGIAGVDVVCGSDQRDQIPDPEMVGGTLWIQPLSYGRFLAVVRMEPEGGRLRPAQWRMAKVPWRGEREPKVAKIIEAYTSRELAAMADTMAGTTGQHEGYEGVQKCAECHQDIAKSWEKTRHAAGWETLKRAGHRYDPECLPCHTTGDPSKLPSVALKGVQCEACHLPMAKHAEYDSGARREKDFDFKPTCVRCHNPERSPTFDFETYLPRVKH